MLPSLLTHRDLRDQVLPRTGQVLMTAVTGVPIGAVERAPWGGSGKVRF